MKKKILIPIVAGMLAIIAGHELSMTNSTTPPVSRTGAPGDLGTCAACHGNLNTGPGDILFSLDTITYFPGSTYTATVQVVDPTQIRWGFELTSLDGANNMAGSFTVTNTLNTSIQTNIGRDYINHKNANSNNTWQFEWTAPAGIVGPITFYIAGNAANNNFANTGDNIYTRSFTIQADSSIITGITSINVTCFGLCNGSATANPVGGFPPYAYQWNDTLNQTTQTATGLCMGTYTVIVTDTVGQTDTASVAITEPAPVISGFTYNGNQCLTGNSYNFTNTGTMGVSYSWNFGDAGTSTFENPSHTYVSCGSFNVTQTVTSGACSNLTSVTIAVYCEPIVSVQGTNVTCNGVCDGTATANISGGTPPYTYFWNMTPVITSNPATDLCPGTYCVTVIDANGCSDSACVTITEPPVLTIGTTSNNASCYGAQDGTATATPSGGISPYTYFWNPYFEGQCTSCDTAVPTFNVDLSSQSDTTWISPATVRNGLCCGANPVSKCIRFNVTVHPLAEGITLDIFSGAIPPGALLYQINCGAIYSIGDFACITGATNFCIVFCKPGSNTNEYSITATSSNCTSAQTDSIATGLGAGTYIVSVTDSNGCTANDSVIITQPQELSIIIDSIMPSTCGNNNGAVCVSVTGGAFPYTVQWDDPNFTNDFCLDSVFAGCYNSLVTDSNGCTFTMPVCINDIGSPIIDSIVTTDATSCNCNGTAKVYISSGTWPFTYIWKNSVGDTIGTNSDSISGLCGGTYSVTNIDSNGCVSSAAFTINASAQLIITHTVANVSCFGGNDGVISANVSGGTGPYAYQWSPPGTDGTNLVAGTYSVVITDVNGCTATDSNIIVTEPTLMVVTDSIIPATCGGANGIATVTPAGGTPGYFYLWNDPPPAQTDSTATGLLSGSYVVIVTDNNGCTQNIPVFVPGTPFPVIDSVIASDFNGSNVDCYGNSTGSATAFVSSGVLPYTYQWDDTLAQTTQTADSLYSGIYSIVVTDSNGCIAIDSVFINEPDSIIILFFQPVTAICLGDSAQISFAFSGGVNPFIISWNSNPMIVSPDTTTTYTLIVMDANGCVGSDSTTVNVLFPLSLSVIASDDTICEGASATLSASTSFGNGGPYFYTWLNDGSTNSTITVSPATDSTFTVVVSDGGCSINDTSSAIVVVEICLGIDESSVQNLKFNVYPNPGRGVFTLSTNYESFTNIRIVVYDVMGRDVYKFQVPSPKPQVPRVEFQIDLSGQPAGIYHLQIMADEGVINKKVIIE